MHDACSGCGLRIANGTDGCQATMDAVWARDFSDPRFFGAHRLKVDAYSVQHPERYCVSAKSMAAHLGGLCCAFEHAEDPEALPALQRWLSANPALVRPDPPAARGALTVAEVARESDPAAHAAAARRWARVAWDAYGQLHPVARGWIARALALRS